MCHYSILSSSFFRQGGGETVLTTFALRCLRRRRSKPCIERLRIMHNIVFESRRVTRTYVAVFDWLASYAVCDQSDLN